MDIFELGKTVFIDLSVIISELNVFSWDFKVFSKLTYRETCL